MKNNPSMSMSAPSLASIRASAQSTFNQLPTPHVQYGLDVHVDFSSLDFSATQTAAQKEPPVRVHDVRPDGIILADFATAFEKYSEKIAPVLGTLLARDDKFESFHLANLCDGLFIYVPARTQARTTITLPSHLASFSHTLILAEPHSAVSLVQAHVQVPAHATFHSSAVEIFAREHSSVHFCTIQDFPLDMLRFSFNRAHVSAHANVTWSYGEFGSLLVKGDVSSRLEGEGASARNLGIFVQNKNQQVDWHDAAHHLAPQTHSHLLARAMLDDESKLVYRALLKMTKEAPGSVGNQRMDSLVLSARAESDPVPALEIEGSDVRCTHAATVGRLDAEKLFYLTSRGLDQTMARALYIQGFFEHVLGQFPPESPVPFFRTHAARKLGILFTKDEITPLLSEVMA